MTGFLDGIAVTRDPKKDAVTRWAFRLEPRARKLARVVLRGERSNNAPDLLGDEPHGFSGILTVRKGDGSAGRGTKKKRMPPCN